MTRDDLSTRLVDYITSPTNTWTTSQRSFTTCGTCGTLTGLPSLLKHSLECVDMGTNYMNYMFDYVANLIENIRFYVTSEI